MVFAWGMAQWICPDRHHATAVGVSSLKCGHDLGSVKENGETDSVADGEKLD